MKVGKAGSTMKSPICSRLYLVCSWKISKNGGYTSLLAACSTVCAYREKVSLYIQSEHLLFQLTPIASYSPAMDCDEEYCSGFSMISLAGTGTWLLGPG